MNDMSSAIVPKSDQINADDLIAGPRTITIRDVKVQPGQEQPVSIYFEGSEKAYRPSKGMARILVGAWGIDPKAYVGRSLTLYNDPDVMFGGMKVGGIRISHMSHMKHNGVHTFALTAKRGSRKPYTVQALTQDNQARSGTARKAPSNDQEVQPVAQSASQSASSPAESDGAGDDAESSSPAFQFYVLTRTGERHEMSDADKWRDTLVNVFETKSLDAAQGTWRANKEFVEQVRSNGYPDHALKVEAAWVKRERAAKDLARGG